MMKPPHTRAFDRRPSRLEPERVRSVARRRQPRRLIITLGAVLAFACAFAAVWAVPQLAPPSGAHAGRSVDFQVVRGDSSGAIAARLQRPAQPLVPAPHEALRKVAMHEVGLRGDLAEQAVRHAGHRVSGQRNARSTEMLNGLLTLEARSS